MNPPPSHPSPLPRPSPWKDLILFAALLFATSALIHDAATPPRPAVLASEAEVVEAPSAEREVVLPREWRWERRATTFDHMFRERR